MNYSPIRISTLKAGINIPFSLYIFFKETYVEYSPSGNEIQKDRFKKLRKQKIAKFYIQDSDESGYQEFMDQLLDATLDDKNASTDDKVQMVEGISQTAIEKMAEEPTSEASYKLTETAAKKLRRLVVENPDALKGVFGSEIDSDPVVKHSINVCALSIKFAESRKLSDEEIDLIATAALMHDVGVLQLEEEVKVLFDKPRSELTPQEKLLFGDHTINVTDILKEKPFVTMDVIELIKNHEENLSGTGPQKKKKLEKTEEILSLVNTYDEKMITEKTAPKDTIKNMMIDEMGNYDLSLMQAFQKFLKEEGLLG